MKAKKNVCRGICGIVAAVVTLSACRQTPETQVVVAKNDGKFEEALQIIDETPPGEKTSGTVSISKEFDSTDGSVHFTVTFDGDMTGFVCRKLTVLLLVDLDKGHFGGVRETFERHF